jgi:thiol:disulfide interchange protein DsbA
MEAFFVAQGVKPEAFSNAYHFSPSIDAQVKNATTLMQTYGIYGIPTIVVNGKYKTNLKLANGDKNRMIKIMQYLIDKDRHTARSS